MVLQSSTRSSIYSRIAVWVEKFTKLETSEVDLSDGAFLDTRSFFNDMEGRYSAVIFAYTPASGVAGRIEYGITVVDFQTHSTPVDALIHAIKTIGGLKMTPVVGEKY